MKDDMNSNSVHTRLLAAIHDRMHSRNVAVRLSEILCIGKEAVYRRLRGEVSFTLDEVASIALDLGISIDDIVGSSDHPNNRSFQLKTTAFVSPSADDYFQMEEWIEIFSKIVQAPDLEMGDYSNRFDMALYYPYSYLSQFHHFKWQYEWRGNTGAKHFDEIHIPERQRQLQLEHIRCSKAVKRSYYIWDHMIFHYIINDILYFKDIRLISDDNIACIKQDLFNLIDYLESIAISGCYETGNSVQLYISNTNLDGHYSYYQCQFFSLSMIGAFTMNSLSSINVRTTNEIRQWILAQKRQATLISESGEIQRIKFFKKQREIISSI